MNRSRRLLSSPYVRCVQPSSRSRDQLGLPIEVNQALAEGMAFEEVLDLLASVDDLSVLCTHGDVLHDVIQALERRGMSIETTPDWRKGVTWVLERTLTDAGETHFPRATVRPPPT